MATTKTSFSPQSSATDDIETVRKRAAAAVARRLALQTTETSKSKSRSKDRKPQDNNDDHQREDDDDDDDDGKNARQDEPSTQSKRKKSKKESASQVLIRGNKRKWREQKQLDATHKPQKDNDDDESEDSDKEEATRKKKKTKEDYNRLRRVLLHRGSHKRLSKEKLRLHVVQVQRRLEGLRARLEQWDAVHETQQWERAQVLQGYADEDARLYQEALDKAAAEPPVKSFGENAAGLKITRRYKPKRMPRRWNPENWKLRGAARPAWEVYDFDTRYVDPHVAAFQQARERRARLENVLVTRRGQFGQVGDAAHGAQAVLQDLCREYLSLWMQLALLKLETKQYKAAREAFLQVLELEHVDQTPHHAPVPVTPARYRLMRMYIQCNKPSSARRFWEEHFLATNAKDVSAWIWYSAVLVEYVSCVLLQEEASTRGTLRNLLLRAVQGNVHAAFTIAYAKQAFHQTLDYTDALQDLFVAPGSVLEAIQYATCEQWHIWDATEGALTWLQTEIQTALSSNEEPDPLKMALQQWNEKLAQEEDEYRSTQNTKDDKHPQTDADAMHDPHKEDNEQEHEDAETRTKNRGGSDNDDDEDNDESSHNANDNDEEENVDLLMYSGMFRTTMEMLQEGNTF